MFKVLNNGKPALCISSGWKNNEFKTFEEAREYARRWLGDFSDSCPNRAGVAVDYNGYGDFIEIIHDVSNLQKLTQEIADELVGTPMGGEMVDQKTDVSENVIIFQFRPDIAARRGMKVKITVEGVD